MISKAIKKEIRGILTSVFLTFFLMMILKDYITIIDDKIISLQIFFGLGNFLEILVYFAFSTFVVFGVKGFFETYSQESSNVIMLISGLILVLIISALSYQILFNT